MELLEYFYPVDEELIFPEEIGNNRLGEAVFVNTEDSNIPDLGQFDIAIIGVNEDRNAVSNIGCGDAPDHIRSALYSLFQKGLQLKIVDLGNLKPGHNPEDTYFALTHVLSELLEINVFPIILGGSQDLTYAQYRAYEKIGQIVSLAAIDPRFDIGESVDEINNHSYLSKIILHQPNYLFNYTNIGYQTYYVDYNAIELLKSLYFDAYRVGFIRENLEESEPLVRNADLLSVDISAIRMSDAPGTTPPSPNGFYGEEICRIMRYAGRSDKLTSIGFYEYNPVYDNRGQTAHLIAQMIWYVLEGFYTRTNDIPTKGNAWNEHNFIKYHVPLENSDHEIMFMKSKKSDRWWMRVPCRDEGPVSYERHYYVPCSYHDYEIARQNEIPDRWWQVYQKLM